MPGHVCFFMRCVLYFEEIENTGSGRGLLQVCKASKISLFPHEFSLNTRKSILNIFPYEF